MGLTREQFLAKADVYETAEVSVPEWGEGATVRIRELSTAARFQWAEFYNKSQTDPGAPDPLSVAVALGAIDDAGAQLLQIQDVDGMREMSGKVVDRIAQGVLDLSGMGKTAVADAAGNSEATPSGGTDTA